jgi:hypothetical protein
LGSSRLIGRDTVRKFVSSRNAGMREIAVPASLLLEGRAYLGFGLDKADITHCTADRPFDGHVS